MRQKLLTPLIVILVVSFGGLLATLIAGYEPALGLDLQGGISVTQQPVGDYSTESLDLAVDRIRERVDSLGVAEPEIIRQGDAIVVNLPGVKNQQQAIDLVKVTGQVYLRPVLQCVAASPTDTSTTTGDTSTATTTATSTGDTATGATTADTATADTTAVTDAPGTTAGGGPSRAPHGASETSTPDTASGDTTADTATSDTASGDTTADTATADTATGDTTAGTEVVTGDTALAPVSTFDPATATTVASDPTTSQVLPLRGGGQCYVGPAGGTGEVFENDAAADILQGSGWGVTVGLRSGSDGEGVWNALAAQCYNGTDTCPSRQLAIELDGEIVSAPTVNAAQFNGNVQITGSFTEGEAKQLARVLKSGSLPVRMQTQSVQTVSPTLGKDSLHAAIVSGLIGVALVMLFMALYYRLLGVIVLAGILVSASLLWTVISWLSKTQGLALSLSGVAGVIVSVGVTVDSYVVFFERLKDEVRAGRTMKNSAQRGFTAAWHTIVVADLVSLMGALVLWYLTVGSVRNFAFFLGLSTLSDLVVAYTFTRPAVLLLARTQWMARRKVMGIEATPSVAASGGAGMSSSTDTMGDVIVPDLPPRRSVWGRLYHGETSIDFYGRRWWGITGSSILIVITIVSLFVSGLNLGIDFEGGVAWEVPSANVTTEQIDAILADHDIPSETAKIQELTSESGSRWRIQVGDHDQATVAAVQQELADQAGVDVSQVASTAVSSSWGSSITEKAIRALIIFLVLVALFISWRFEWQMALAAIFAMVHDVLISVGVYSVVGFEVTPATVVAFLTILGFSLYDTIVVFDKVKENEARYFGLRASYADTINVSMNQVLMRSLNTSLAAVLPVLSLLVLGSGVFGAIALREFALALLVGLITGSYSSIYIASPLLAVFKERSPKYRNQRGQHATGNDLERLVLGGTPTSSRRDATRVRRAPGSVTAAVGASSAPDAAAAATPESLLSHPPRPRKKKRR